MANKEIVSTNRAPAAIGPYSQAVKSAGLVFTAGVIPLDPDTKLVVGDEIREQATRVLTSLQALLEDAGASLQSVIKTTCYLQNLDDFPAFNEIYASFFIGDETPARTTVQVVRLPMGVLVEIDCIANTDD
jgi:2-iminobutanoate/2-iminopropanoate deaminase